MRIRATIQDPPLRSRQALSRRAEAAWLFCLLLGLLFGLSGSSRDAEASGLLQNRTVVLSNGLTVILHEDHRTPFVAVLVRYRVGVRNEVGGPSGLAHLFEHILFRGSDHIAPLNQHQLLYQLAALEYNGTTALENTDYYEVIPAANLETALWMESDRMGFPILGRWELRNELEIVRSERRQRYQDAPYSEAQLRQWQALFPAGHPYHHNSIGSAEDLASITIEQARSFFERFYGPNNAVLTLSGDFETERALKLVEKYFGSLKSRPVPPPPAVAPLRIDKEIVLHHTETQGRSPVLRLCWLTPPSYTKLDTAADLLALILSRGRVGRLQRRLQGEPMLAQTVGASQQSLSHESLFTLIVTAQDAAALPQLHKILDEILEEIARDGVSEEELTSARRWMRAALFHRMESLTGKARILTEFYLKKGRADWQLLDFVRYQNVTSKDIQDLVREHLRPNQRVVIYAEPAETKGGVR